MTDAPGGLTPTRSVNDLIASAGANDPGATLLPIDLMRKASASLTLDDVWLLAQTIDRLATEGVTGVVVTQGTDTLEEVAFAIDLLAAAPIPVVFTGAMRSASAAGYDGAQNLDDAIRVARHAGGRSEVFVVMNGVAHAPRFVTKTHTSSLAAFASPDHGPLMQVHEARVYEAVRLRTPRAPHIALAKPLTWPRVALLQLGLADDCALAPKLKELDYEGCVIAAMGGGHAPDFAVENIERAARAMPVVMCSRASAGRVFERTYGYPGGEIDLLQRGIIASGLGAAKSRLLLTLCIAEAPDSAGRRFADLSAVLSH